jgi:chemotaxis protein MotA
MSHAIFGKPSKPRRRIDVGALLAAPLGIGVVLAAQTLAGVPAGTLFQAEAALIVFGGTLAAVLISHSPREVLAALRAAGRTFVSERNDVDTVAATITTLAGRAHRRGLIALESDVETIAEPFLREGVKFAIDESSVEAVRELMTVEAQVRASQDDVPARIFDAAAGYAPTLGILGAVLGLIDVMRHLSAPASLGSGIATAFIATAYGVGVSNLLLLPMAGRLRERAHLASRRRDLMTHGVCGIHQRMHPKMLAHKLRAFGAGEAAVIDRAGRFAAPAPSAADVADRLPA